MAVADGQIPAPRAVRSFVRRAGRLTGAQRQAVERHWPAFGLEPSGVLDFSAVFGRSAKCSMEIGFGMGDALVELAAATPERDFLGVEVHEPGIGRVLRGISESSLANVRIVRGDAVDLLRHHIADHSLDTVLVFFPDPWPKKRHHKRRLIQPAFVALLAGKLSAGGRLHLATDWQDYALHIRDVVNADQRFRNLAADGGFSPRPATRPVTKFEARGTRLGHGVWDLVYERVEFDTL